jgi:hypothetical protein
VVDDSPRDRPHLFIAGGGAVEPYRRPQQVMVASPLPERDRERHSAALHAALAAAVDAAHRQRADRDSGLDAGTPGFYLDVEIPSDQVNVLDRLENRRQHVELVAVREPSQAGAPLVASVFVPAQAEAYYSRKVEEYRTGETRKGRPRNEPLIAGIETVRIGSARSLFTDPGELFPRDRDERVWWEVWLRGGRREDFERVARALDIGLKPHAVKFPEREVVLALSSAANLDRLVAHSDVVGELRRAKDTPAFFIGLGGAEQRAWSDDLLGRLTRPDMSGSVSVCLLDSGVRRTHPLIEGALSEEDCHTINPAWGTDDTPVWQGHGTRMAGVALYGDLVPVLTGAEAISNPFRLESVRILPPADGPANEPELYGAIMEEAVARTEIQAPRRRRATACAVTSTSAARGRPSSWSSAVDQLCFEEPDRRLVILSAGNIRDDLVPADYPARNEVEPVDDPAQAWNALTVGAYTDKVDIIDADFAGWHPVAPAGELSPRSRTSVTWDNQWPIKPDVVFEGGNLAHDGRQPGQAIDDLQLLTTYFRPETRHFATLGDTSAATALAANMAGSILAERPGLWPETVRGLIVHSAEWTPPMIAAIAACGGRKGQINRLQRTFGYGVPDLDRALRSARNDLTLMVEDDLHPFKREGNAAASTRDMKLHTLPWPQEALAEIGEAAVELRVTLSYFIEPNPGERGRTRRHRYASHGLRFQVKRAAETLDEFRGRINQAARDEEAAYGGGGAYGGDEWLLGTARDRGSVHSDIWRGTAADLATRDAVGVYPVGGWWKEKPYLERYAAQARYSLIVTIRAPGTSVDIYTPVAAQISIPVPAG